MNPARTFYFAFFLGALVRRLVPYATVVYGFEVLGGHHWSGIFYFALVTPYVFFSLASGRAMDREPPSNVARTATLWTVPGVALLTIAAAFLAPTPVTGTLIAVMLFAYGTAYAFAYPAFIAAIPQVASPEAVNRTTIWVNVLAIICLAYAPAVVGALREVLPWRWLFAIFAALALLAAVTTTRVAFGPRPPAPPGTSPPMRSSLRAHLRKRPLLAALLLSALAFSGLVVGPLEVLLPHYAEHTLHLGPLAAGALIAVGGTGLVVGSVFALRLLEHGPLGFWLCVTGAVGSAVVVLMTFLPSSFAFPLLFISGMLGGAFSSISISGTQANTTEAWRGRVMGVFALIFGGVPGIGGFLSGTAASAFGTVSTIRIAFTAATAVFLLLYLLLPALRTPSLTPRA